MCDANVEPKVAVSVEMKVNLGNYESVGLSAVLSGLRKDSTEAEINELLSTADIGFDMIRDRLKEKAYEVKQERAAARSNGQR